MISTDGPDTGCTGRMSSTYARVAVPVVQTSKILVVLRVSRVLTDAPSILDTLGILRVSSTFRTPSTESAYSTGGLNTRALKSMSSTDGPNTGCAGRMISTYARVEAVPAVQTSKILAVLQVSRVLNPENSSAFE